VIAPEELRHRQQWLLWRFEPNPKKPDGKKLKVPYYISGKRRMGTQGSDDDRSWLSLYHSVIDELSRSRGSRLPYDGIGFAFLPGDGLIGIDLDHMLDKDTGELSQRALSIVQACASYTEWSPSKAGLHIIVKGETVTNKSDKIGVEIFCGAQYFTFTGELYSGAPSEVAEISAKALARLHATVNEAKGKSRPAPAAPGAAAKPAAGVRSLDNDFKKVNDAALANLDAWVPALFPDAKRSSKGYRVTSHSLGRDLEEDLSITQDGIKDWGVADIGDPREGGRTPIDLVLEWGPAKKPKDALHWLAAQLGITLSSRAPAPRGTGSGGNTPPPGGWGRGPNEDGDSGEPPPEGVPVIKVKAGLLPQAVDLAEQALLDFPERIYQRSGFITRVVKRDRPSVRNYTRDAGSLGVHTVDQNYLLELFNRAAVWEKWNVKSEAWVRCHCPDQVASFYLARVGRWKLPKLWSVVSAPTLRPDGTLLQKPGYDEATNTYYDPCGVKFPAIPDKPSREDAEAALKLLLDLFKSFPFEQELDRAVALSLALTALVRRALPSAPLGAFTAPIMGSGKTLMADCISILAAGVSVPAMTYPEREEEAEKTALSVLMEGDPVVLIDNVERPLQGAWLCSILTQEVYQQRVLGRSEMMRVPTTTLWLATGNQLVVAGDLRTRTLLCRIDPKSEHPEQRSFAGDLREWTTSNRPALVAAGLTLIRAFMATGTPVSEICKPWGRFERWSEMVRAPLIWLGCDDPCRSLAALEGDDPERNELARMLASWRACFGIEPTSAREAVERTMPTMAGLDGDAKALGDVLKEIAAERGGGLSVRRLGKWLQKHSGRRIDGNFFTKASERDHVALWKVMSSDKGGTAPATG
jgi:hypothetical protein